MIDRVNGGPAFPVDTGFNDGEFGHQTSNITWQHSGMTLRDYFAAKAMHQFLHGAVMPVGFDASDILRMVGERAYEVADAMLKARRS
jgi:hypothetical protein